MELVKIEAENIGVLKTLTIECDRDLIEITGKNGSGKSTALRLVDMLLYTDKVKEKVLRDGTEKAWIAMDVVMEINGKDTPLRIERKFTEKNQSGSVKITSELGSFPNSMAFLKELFGEVSLDADPMWFAQAKPEEQVKVLVKALGKELELDKLKGWVKDATGDDWFEKGDTYETLRNAYKAVETFRRDTNRDIKKLETLVADMPQKEVLPVSITDLQAKRDEIQGVQQIQADIRRYEQAKEDINQQIENLQKQISDLQVRAVNADKEIAAKKKQLPKKDLGSIEEIDKQMAQVAETNALAQAWTDSQKKREELTELKAASKKCDDILETIQSYKHEVVDVSRLGVPGLEIADDELRVNGIPLTELSSTERADLALRIKHAMNPKAPAIFIDEWSSWDSDHKEQVKKFAGDNKLLLLVAMVSEDSQTGIELTDKGFVDHYKEKK